MGWLRPARTKRVLPDKLPASVTGRPQRTVDRRVQFFSANGGYDGARRDRTTHDWIPGNRSPYSLHMQDAAVLRERARDLVINNPHASSAVDAYIANVIECGITPKPRFDGKETRKQWSAAFDHWAANEADVTETQHLYELQTLFLTEVIVGGGCLQHYRVLRKTQRRRIQAAIELIPEERFADDHDTMVMFQNRKKSGNPISRGIELEASTGRRVAYWIRQTDPNDAQVGNIGEIIRIPADRARYSFIKTRVGQVRGMTLLAPVIMWLWKLGYYTDNELLSSAIKSCWSAVITTDQPQDYPDLADGDPDGSSTDLYGNDLEKIQPGMIGRLRPGEGVTGVGPNVPGSDSIAWLTMIQRAIAIGLHLSYEEMARDYSKGSFSSVRAAMNSDRKRFYMFQQFMAHEHCTPAYEFFARWAVLGGIQGFPTVEQFASNTDEWLSVRHQTPGWISVNPKEDAVAKDTSLANYSTTLEELGGADGEDWEDRLEQAARERERKIELGLEQDLPDTGMDNTNQTDGNQRQETGGRTR
jgi:lambda family phage portal protein